MSGLRIYLLGPPFIEIAGIKIKFDSRKNLALLAYLAVSGESHSREALVTLLWPELEPGRARAGLRRNLSNIKKAFGDRWLFVDREFVELDAQTGFWLDIDQFDRLLNSWQEHGHTKDDACPDCLDALAEAVDCYRGDFLEGFSLRDSLAFDEWQFFQTEDFRGKLTAVLERLVAGCSAQGAYQEAIPYARRWLALDPLHEPVHQYLMSLYAHNGQRGAALRQYRECVRILDAELGISPSEQITILHDQIISKKLLDKDTLAAAPAPKHNLQAQSTPFVGRQDELDNIRKQLSEPDCRLLTLTGPGGAGKTRLALQAAAGFVASYQIGLFEDGIFFVPLASLQSTNAIVPAIAQVIGCTFYEGGTPKRQLLDYLSQKSILLVLDNFEHLLEGVNLVNEILAAAPGTKILATSRARLKVSAEHNLQVSGMPYPDWELPEDTRAYSAVQLFIHGARRAQPGFEPRAEDMGHIAHICRLVQGTPLGILLAAAWAELLSPQEIAAEIGQSLDFLDTDFSDAPERQRSIRAVFDHSWRLLAKREQEVFQGLSVFRGGFTRQAAQQVAQASLRDIKSLVDKSLLQRAAAGRYEVHDLLRGYAAEKLDQADSLKETLLDRYSAFYAAVLEQLEVDLKTARQQAAITEIDQDIDDALAAWDWASERGQIRLLDQALNGLALYHRWRSLYQEGKDRFGAAAKKLSENLDSPTASPGDAERVLAKLLAWQSRLWGDAGDHAVLQRSLTLLERCEQHGQDVRQEKAFLLQQMAWPLAMAGDEKARNLCDTSINLYTELGDRFGQAEALDILGGLATSRRLFDQARISFQQSLALRQEIGDHKGIARSIARLSGIARTQEKTIEADRLLQESIEIAQKIGDQGQIASAHTWGANILVMFGKPTQARTLLERNPALSDNLGLRTISAQSLLGVIHLQLGEYEQARTLGESSLALSRDIGYQPGIGRALWLRGSAALAQGEYLQAASSFSHCLTTLQDVGASEEQCWALAGLGYVACCQGQLEQAREYLSEMMRVFDETRSDTISDVHQFALPALALYLVAQGETAPGVELWALACSHPFVANSCWFNDIAGQHITTAAAALPPETLAACQIHGKSLDWYQVSERLTFVLGEGQ